MALLLALKCRQFQEAALRVTHFTSPCLRHHIVCAIYQRLCNAMHQCFATEGKFVYDATSKAPKNLNNNHIVYPQRGEWRWGRGGGCNHLKACLPSIKPIYEWVFRVTPVLRQRIVINLDFRGLPIWSICLVRVNIDSICQQNEGMWSLELASSLNTRLNE